jgi:Flp pilus assembly protein TadG
MTAEHQGRVTNAIEPARPRRLRGETDTTLNGDGGYALVFTALMLVPLIIATAFAVDVGSWYAQAARTQRAADSAALAGAVWLPRTDLAIAASNKALAANWYGTGAAPTCASSNVTCASTSGEWKVNIGAPASRFFSQVAGIVPFDIDRGSAAIFNKPVPLGSPLASFGNNLTSGCTNPSSCATDPNGNAQPALWASINGPYRQHEDGDPFATRCWGKSGGESSCLATTDASGPNPVNTGSMAPYNPEYKRDGYLYAVEVKTAGPVTVEVYDASCTTNNSVTGDQSCDGDSGTNFQMYPWSSPYQITATTPMAGSSCSGGTSNIFAPPQPDTGSYANKWVTLCTFNAATPGIYPIRVSNDNIAGRCPFTNIQTANANCIGDGINSFSLRASGPAGTRLYAVDYMSIWNNASGTSRFYLGEVAPTHKGKKLVISMYDAGDGPNGATFTMKVKRPPTSGNAAANGSNLLDVPCTWQATQTQGAYPTGQSGTASPACAIVTRDSNGQKFNARWLEITIDLPNNYTCTTDCWWRVEYAFTGGTPNDRTVWALKIIGDPVHLVN